MACLDLDSPQLLSYVPICDFPLELQLDSFKDEFLAVPDTSTSSLSNNTNVPEPPPLPDASYGRTSFSKRLVDYRNLPYETKHAWDRLFYEGYEADIRVVTDDKGIILAHSCILRRQNQMQKREERKVYMQLYEAMEALLHICNDGCRTIGPRDKMLKGSQATCGFPACKGVESLVRHFSGCKTRVPGRCIHCKRMWQLLKLHSCMCTEPDSCKVPLCRHFKDKIHHQNKKEERKWKLLVKKVLGARGTISSISAWKYCVA